MAAESPNAAEEMVKSYKGDAKLKSSEEAEQLCAWLACAEGLAPLGAFSPKVDSVERNGYYNPDQSMA